MLAIPAFFQWAAGFLALFTGKRIITSTGKRVLKNARRRIAMAPGESCCCVVDCSFCTSTPTTITVTISSWVANPCTDCTGGGRYRVTTTGDLNGTYDLPQLNACDWEVTIPAADFEVSAYIGGGCVTFVSTVHFKLRVSRVSSIRWSIDAYSYDDPNGILHALGSNCLTDTASLDCTTTPSTATGTANCIGGSTGNVDLTLNF